MELKQFAAKRSGRPATRRATGSAAGRGVRAALVAAAALLTAASGGDAAADVRAHPLFTSGCVLQQGQKVRIFGYGDDGETVSVRIQDQEASTVVENGRWSVEVGPLRAGTSNTMQFSGSRSFAVTDVGVGEVWICAGDANMQVQVLQTPSSMQAMTNRDNRKLRLFTVRRAAAVVPQPVTSSLWTQAGAGSVGVFSAVGYYFGRDINSELDVPVGLISCSHYAATCDSFISREAIEAVEGLKPQLTARPPNANTPGSPTVLYNGMVDDLRQYAVAGVIYYQGETDWDRAFEHRIALPTLIADWRQKFNRPEMPFLFVQAAPYRPGGFVAGESRLAVLRESQMLAWKSTPRTAMVVLTDGGNAYELHPRDKQIVGKRLALAARAIAYGQNIVYSGPRFAEVKFESGKAIIKFDFLGGGLSAEAGKVTGVTISGRDGVFKPAEAKIEGETVVAHNPEVPVPTAVRYGWSDYPDCNLFNQEGLPASPFRSDVPAKPTASTVQ
jgi:sialate O-acetylesterase